MKQKSFEDFYEWTSARGDQLTLGKLQRAFQPFIDQGSISAACKEQPIFDVPPVITTEGLLVSRAIIPRSRTRSASCSFIYESPRWRLFGMSVNVRK